MRDVSVGRRGATISKAAGLPSRGKEGINLFKQTYLKGSNSFPRAGRGRAFAFFKLHSLYRVVSPNREF